MSIITFTVEGPSSRGGGLAKFTPRQEFFDANGELVSPGKSWRDVPYQFDVEASTNLPDGPWWVSGVDKRRYPIDVDGPADLQDLIVAGLPDKSPVTSLSQAVQKWMDANVDTEVTGPLVEGILADPESGARTVLDETYAPIDKTLLGWANAGSYSLVTATRNTAGGLTGGTVKWPDGATGTLTTTLSTDPASLNAVNGFVVTHVLGGTTTTFTQPTMTRDSTTGAVTAQPELVVS